MTHLIHPNRMASNVMLYRVSVCGVSDIGLVRQNNEDCWRALQDEQFFALADGMGGHQAGEIASREAMESLCLLFRKCFDPTHDLVHAERCLKYIIQEVNAAIYHMGREHSELRGMGTTLCCALIHPEGLIYAHVGDSRIYRFRRGKLEQLTRDHSLLRELMDLGQVSEQQAAEFTYKNIITRAIGTEASVEPSVGHTALEADDVIVMCTDGLSDLVSSREIEGILSRHPETDSAALLVKKAKEKGGYDNITVVVMKVREKDEAHLP